MTREFAPQGDGGWNDDPWVGGFYGDGTGAHGDGWDGEDGWHAEDWRPRRTWPQRLVLALAVVCLLGLVVSAAGLSWGVSRYRSIEFVPVEGAEGAGAREPSNWLLVGSDARDSIDPDDPRAGAFLGEAVTGTRTDTIMVARVDPGRGTIDLVSVPRDLWVPIAGSGGEGRINSAFAGEGGQARLVATVEGALGVDVHHYAEIDFGGFQSMIDALGGVAMWFDTPVRDPSSGLDVGSPGCHLLDGSTALAFARSRSLEYHNGTSWRTDPTGDLGRTARQQYLMSRLAATAAANLDPRNPRTVDRLVQAGVSNLTLGDGAGIDDLVGLARAFAAAGSAGVRRHALPVTPFTTQQGAAVLALETGPAQSVLDIFRGLVVPAPPISSESPEPDAGAAESGLNLTTFRVDVMNGAQVAGVAQGTADRLSGAGFVIGDIGNEDPVERTVIRHPARLAPEAAAVATALGVDPVYEIDDTLARVRLIVGPDLATAGTVTTPTTAPTTPPAEAAPAPDETPRYEVGIVPTGPPPGTPCP